MKEVKWMTKLEGFIGEATTYDKKQAVETKRPKSWCKTISAFANTNGGTLLFGVADDDTIIGLPDAEADAEKISEIIKTHLEPIPDFGLQFCQRSGKKLIALKVYKGEETPYYYHADGTTEAYIRVGNESVPAVATDLKRLVLRGRNSSFDSLTSSYKSSDYSFTKVRERYKIWTNKSLPEESYLSWGMEDDNGNLTNAGALLADESPVRYSRVFCTRWNGLTKSGGLVDALDHQEYNGSVISLLSNAEAFIRVHTKTVWKKTDNSRLEFPESVHRSYFEALVNALVHRDYLDYGSEVHVDIFDDRLEIYSPGGMFDGTNIQDRNIRRIPSRRRNPVLADIFDRLGYMERSGSGFGKILDGYENAVNFQTRKEPEFYSDNTMFLVILPNLNYSDGKSAEKSAESAEKSAELGETVSLLTKRQREILNKMEVGIEYKAEDIENMIGLKHSRTRQLLMGLVKQGLIRTTAETKNRRYVKVRNKRKLQL